MQIHKFGGASINSADRIRNVASIISGFPVGKNLVVVSALGKTTNALENVIQLWNQGEESRSVEALNRLRDRHLEMGRQLFPECKECIAGLNVLFDETSDTLLDIRKDSPFNKSYDAIVHFGELFSSFMVSQFLRRRGIFNVLLDVREVLKTNEHFREAGILWKASTPLINKKVTKLFEETFLIITQGFIGSTFQGDSTTLGREGSDFTAAVFANTLHAESLTIWKDVSGVMNADPKQITDAIPVSHLDYKEVVEMAYYGAQVIHPKTIKPLQNENIPLLVKSFLDPLLPGTVINGNSAAKLPPMIVFKHNQILLTFQTRDFSFVEGKPSRKIKQILASSLVKANLTQNTAISLLVCMDNIEEKRKQILHDADEFFVTEEQNLCLLTIRHYDEEIIKKLTHDRKIILEQRTRNTIQVLFREE